MNRYHVENFDIAKLSPNNIDRIQISMIPEGANVLEIGCATGFMSEYLKKKMNCRVTGIEAEPAQAKEAEERCDELICGKIDNTDIQRKLDDIVQKKGRFDVVFMSQVIEHIAYPEDVLTAVHRWIAPGGFLIISTCNIAHWRCRMKLMMGRWEYEESGVYDNSHLRFFTINSFQKMMERCKYEIIDEGYSVEEFCPFKLLIGVRIFVPSVLLKLIPFIGKKLAKMYIRKFRNFISYQFAFKAVSISENNE